MYYYGDEIVHYKSDGTWEILNTKDAMLPGNYIASCLNDGTGGIWIGMGMQKNPGNIGGLVHYKADGTWEVFKTSNSGLPHNGILSLLSDELGGIWIGTNNGLAHYKADGTWEVFNTKNELPDNSVGSLLYDGSGGIWIGTKFGGLAYYQPARGWEIFNISNSELSDNDISGLLSDDEGGIWIGTGTGLINWGGLFHYTPDGTWKVFNTENSALPHNDIGALSKDGEGGIWIGTLGGGLAHYKSDGTWEVFNTGNSGLPDNNILSLLPDGAGGIWIGTGRRFAYENNISGGLAHYKADGTWTVITTKNSPLPDNKILTLLNDGAGGIWIGTTEGLAHYKSDGTWEVLNSVNSRLSCPIIYDLLSDGAGGIWIGSCGGLDHYIPDGTWEVFNAENSGLPDDSVQTIISDNAGGLWVGTTWGGLAHLTFSTKSHVIENIVEKIEESTSEEELAVKEEIKNLKERLLHGTRAAIIVHPRGMRSGRKQFVSIETMATYAYKTLLARGYDNSEIYFLSYKPDVDVTGDGMADLNVVDGPVTLADMRKGASPRDITLDDLKEAFDWAKTLGKLDQPLLFIFVDHGGTDQLILSPENDRLGTSSLKDLFDDYQSATGGTPIVAILEACYSGSLIDELSRKDRIIVASAGVDSRAYYDNLGYMSFTKFYFDYLRRGIDFYESFNLVKQKLSLLKYPFSEQTPLFDDDGDGTPNTSRDGRFAENYCLNGCFGGFAGEISFEPIGLVSQDVAPNQNIEIKVKVFITEGSLREVKAVIRTPETTNSIDEFGFPTISTRVINLVKEEDGIWSGSFSEFIYNGDYYLTFTAKDQDGFVAQSESPIVFTLHNGKTIEGVDTPPETLPVQHESEASNTSPSGDAAAIEIAYPIIERQEYRYGQTLTVKVPQAPQGIAQYVAIGLPDGSVYLFTGKNMAVAFTGGQLPRWQGGELALDIPLGPPFGVSLPMGKYTVYLLRIQTGLDPLMNLDAWRLGSREFYVVK